MNSNNSTSRSWFMVPLIVVVAALAVAFFLTGDSTPTAASAAVADNGDVLARVGSIEITVQEVEEDLASELMAVNRERQEILEKGLDAAIEEALLELEAAAQGVPENKLLEQVYADVAQPSEADIDAFYEGRKARINKPKEEVAGQIRNYLLQQSRQNSRNYFLKGLRERYEVVSYIEPIRMAVSAGSAPSFGPANAPVTIVEFSDFQCPYCQRLAPTIDQVKAKYGDQVRVVFRQFPLPIHDNAQKAAEASLCAAEEGKFWEMHDAMFANIRALGVDDLKKTADGLNLADGFDQCLDSGKFASQVAEDLREGRAAGVTGTPAMFINGRFVSGAVPFDQIAKLIEDELEREAQSGSR
jgi:protein-disulfide isomerase